MTLKYLAYGSNLLNQRLLERVPSCRYLESVYVPAYRLNFDVRGIDGSGKCNMFHTGNTEDVVHAAVYEIARSEKVLLDAFEGDSYAVQEMTVSGQDEHDVFVYIGKANYLVQNLPPFEWYRDIVVAGARSRGFPDSYVAQIIAHKFIHDPDQTRHAEHQRIIRLGEK